MSDAVAVQKQPGPSGRVPYHQGRGPIFGSLRRRSSVMCHSGHKTFPCQSYDKGTRVAPCTNLKSGTPNSQFYSGTTPKLISIVIPARNEEENIVQTVTNLEKAVEGLPHETVVVNDHSIDHTIEKINSLTLIYPAVVLIHNTDRPGFASALWTGFQSARGDAVVVVMADACDEPATIPAMVSKFQQGYDLVCGSRYIRGGGKEKGPKLQGFFSFVINKFLHLFFRIPTTDASNAFKIYRREILLKMRTTEKEFALSLELAINFWKKGYKIIDVPTLWKGRIKGKSKFKFRRALFSYGWQIIHLCK